MSAIPPENIGVAHLSPPPTFIAFRTRRGGIWFAGKLVQLGNGEVVNAGDLGGDGGELMGGDLSSMVDKAPTTTTGIELPTVTPIASTPASLALTTCSSPLTAAVTESSTLAVRSSISPCSSVASHSATATPQLSPPVGLVTTPPVPALQDASDLSNNGKHLVETYYGRRLRRYDSEVAAISSREYQRLLFREQNVARKAYGFKRDALLARRAQLVAELGASGRQPISTACDPHAPPVAHATSSPDLLDGSGSLLSAELVFPRLTTSITQGPAAGPVSRPSTGTSAAIVHAAAAYAHRVTRRVDELPGHDVVISPFGSQVIIRNEAGIDETWHGDCDGVVVEAFLASLRLGPGVCHTQSIELSPLHGPDSDTEWSLVNTSVGLSSDGSTNDVLDIPDEALWEGGELGVERQGSTFANGTSRGQEGEHV